MNIGGILAPEEPAAVFFIGQHEAQRPSPVSLDLLGQAQNLGYDFMTAPITTAVFHSRVIEHITDYYESLDQKSNSNGRPLPLISPLTPADTNLTPEDSNSSLVGIASPWIDLGSKDPVIAHVSRQIFNMEVAYAAFCGINNITVHGPLLDAEVVQFARAIHEGLGLGPYLQLHILLPMTGELEQDHGFDVHLSELARTSDDNDVNELDPHEPFGVWDNWHTIRTTCNYSHKLSIGTKFSYFMFHDVTILLADSPR